MFQYEKDANSTLISDPESGVRKPAKNDTILSFISRIFLQSFTMTFLAEWGDRSQLTTIILGAREVIHIIKKSIKKNIYSILFYRMFMELF